MNTRDNNPNIIMDTVYSGLVLTITPEEYKLLTEENWLSNDGIHINDTFKPDLRDALQTLMEKGVIREYPGQEGYGEGSTYGLTEIGEQIWITK